MNMSGENSGFYELFPAAPHFGPPNPLCNQPKPPPTPPQEYTPYYPPNYPNGPHFYSEYSLWGSSYDPAQLLNRASDGIGVFGQRPSPPFPPPVQFRSEYHEEPPLMPSVPPDAVTQTDDEGGSEKPELTGLEEPEKTVIEREKLYKYPDDYNCLDMDEIVPDAVEQSSNSSGSSSGDWTHTNFQRAGAFPSAYPWASRPARVVNNRGKKANIMQRRLVRALSQPVKIDKGASMMQRMGWMGGGLGRDEAGIVEPIEPNAIYATTTLGFGQSDLEVETKTAKVTRTGPKKRISKAIRKEYFKTNVLLQLRDFVKNDLLLELYFDTKLKSGERKRIHRLVSAIDDREDSEELDTVYQQEIVTEIQRRNKYSLDTQSDGEGTTRQICVFKSAPKHMFLITPDDCRPCITEIKEVEEEPNPFLKSITKHIKKDEGTILQPKPPHLIDKLIEFFIDFCADDTFSEFRFLGPFTKREIYVINNFFSLINDLAMKQKPCFKCPVELLDVFATDYKFHSESDPNGFMALIKAQFKLREEFEKQQQEKREQERRLNRIKYLK